MKLTRDDKRDAIMVVLIAVGVCIAWWFLMR